MINPKNTEDKPMKAKYFLQTISFITWIFFLHCSHHSSNSKYSPAALLLTLSFPQAEKFNEEVEFNLIQSSSCEEVKNYLIDNQSDSILRSRYRYNFGIPTDTTTATTTTTTATGTGSPTNPAHSTTNLQESGVDEPDTVKTDGFFSYTLQNNKFYILKSFPLSELNLVSAYNFTQNEYPTVFFLDADKVALFVSVRPDYTSSSYSYDTYISKFKLVILDIKDKAKPVLLNTYEFEGSYHSARKINTDIYVVSNYNYPPNQNISRLYYSPHPELPPTEYSSNAAKIEALTSQTKPILRKILNTEMKDISTFLPKFKQTNSASEPLTACDEFLIPNHSYNGNQLHVTGINLESGKTSSSAVFVNAQNVYASGKNLYITNSHIWGARATSLSALAYSAIYKFQIEKKVEFLASGKIQGSVLNQFSMSEYNDFFKITSTDTDGNNLFIMKESGKKLKTIGQVTGLAKGERIYSTRMIKDRAYVVTFRQIDPLYVIDTSDSSSPRVLSELKIPGVSYYIHPMSDGYLLTIGRDSTSTGFLTGLQLQIFDVRDSSNPIQKFKETIPGNTYSSSLWNHHSFNYYPTRGQLAFPLSVYANNTYHSGLSLYTADVDSGFQLLGNIDHNSLASNYCSASTESYLCYNYYRPGVNHSVFIENNIYTFSPYGMQVNEGKANVPFKASRSFHTN